MEIIIMSQAVGTKKHLVIIMEDAYKTRTLQQIGDLVCDSYHVTMEQVNVDLQEVEEIDIVDDYGVNRMPVAVSRGYGHGSGIIS